MVNNFITNLIHKLLSHGIVNGKEEFYFMCESMGIDKAHMLSSADFSREQAKKIKKMVAKRCKHIPLQLILKQSPFFNITILESKHTLTPRPETELLATMVAKEQNIVSVLDLCCGSGCIGLSLKKAGVTNVTLCDVSDKAIKQCIKNAKLNNLDVQVIKSDMFKNITSTYDLIVSNPPYIPTKQLDDLEKEVKKYDPIISLDGGDDGLDFYKIIAQESPNFLNENGKLYLEIGIGQEQYIVKLLENSFKNITIIPDYNGINRFIRAEKC